MKKLIYTIGFLMFMSVVLRPGGMIDLKNVFAADSETENCIPSRNLGCKESQLIERVLKDNPDKNLDWGQSFGESDPESIAQDLYLIIYKDISLNSLDEAINATANQYGMPVERMSEILYGDIKPILERNPLMTIERATEIYRQIIATYEDKKDSAEVKNYLNSKILPNEMFADGKLENSGFDLVVDLNNIETILFQRAEPITYGGNYVPSVNTDDNKDGSKLKDDIIALPIDFQGEELPLNQGEGSSNKKSDQLKKSNENPFKQAEELKKSVFDKGINPNICFTTQDLDKSLDKFAKDSQGNSKLKNNFDAQKDLNKLNSDDQSNSRGDNNGALNDIGVDIPIDLIPIDNQKIQNVQSAEPGDYSKDPLCGDILCITFETFYKPATPSFTKTDNCIQCHVQYINESLQKTVNHSLIPAKATGNLGESALCKNAAAASLSAIGMNISVNMVPVVTPPKNDLMNVGNISDEWDKYAQTNGFWNYGEKQRREADAKKKNGVVDYSPIPSDMERMLVVELFNAAENSTIDDVMSRASSSYEKVKVQAAQEQLVVEIAQDAYGEIDTYDALEDEMKQMNGFFENFKDQMRTLYEDVPGLNSTKSCTNLNNKRACT